MTGKIEKGIAGFYYVHVPGNGIYECKAKGIFRNRKEKPLVGDDVKVDILSEEEKTGNIIKILPRVNSLIRPAVANVDQALVVFSIASPTPNLNLLDRFLLMMQWREVPTIICFNKTDIVSELEQNALAATYERCGCKVLFISVRKQEGLKEVHKILQGKTTVLAGPSGVGKSSLMNDLYPNANMETGQISEKIQRGKHTTRHSELFHIDESTYLMDTPGFSNLELPPIEKEELREYFVEFEDYEGQCRFLGCVHIHEPDCEVKRAWENGEISDSRYQNYQLFFEEIKNRRNY